MHIIVKMKLDRRQSPYWSAMLVENDKVIVEVVSDTFNPRNKKDFRERYENVTARLMTEFMQVRILSNEQRDDQVVYTKMFLADTWEPSNGPADHRLN